MAREAQRADQQVRILIVDDHDLVREGVTARLDGHPNLKVIGEAATAAAAIGRVAELTPDVVVLDYQLPDGNGIDLCRHIRDVSPAIKCVIYTGSQLDHEAATRAGAAAVVLKRLVGDDLITTIEQITCTTI